MEVGAVKQAFNNEVIHLKKKLNQAKIQIIHKLTRKAKTLTQKKGPEALQIKFKRKAESAVREVLEIKKITSKDLAKFAVTHKGKLSDFLNKPTVDKNRASARLLLHKVLEDKYNFLRETYTNITIDDLLLSREERKKLKKKKLEEKQNKKKNRQTRTSESGNWSVEDIDAIHCNNKKSKNENQLGSENESLDEKFNETSEEENKDESDFDENEIESNKNESHSKQIDRDEESGDTYESPHTDDETPHIDHENSKTNEKFKSRDIDHIDKCSDNENEPKYTKLKNETPSTDRKKKEQKIVTKANTKKQKQTLKNNKKLEEKILNKKFSKDKVELPRQENKIVDPFFITASGENYMSLVEPRLPDEVKDEHKQGNRKLRRAAMFGHKLKRTYKNNNFDDNRFNNNNKNKNNIGSFDKQNNYYEEKKYSNVDNRIKTNNLFDKSKNSSDVPEKLHPSWEAKKKQSGLLPFKGKKIVFE